MYLYLSGALPFLGAGAERIPPRLAGARERPASLFAELGAVPGWSLRPSLLAEVRLPSRIVVSSGTPSPLRRAAEELEPRLAGARALEVDGDGLPHLDAVARAGRPGLGTALSRCARRAGAQRSRRRPPRPATDRRALRSRPPGRREGLPAG